MRIPKKKARPDKGNIRITPRVLKFLRWVADGHKVSVDLVQILLVRLDFMEWVDDYTIKLDVQGLLLPETNEPLPAPARDYEVTKRRAYKWLSGLTQAGYLESGGPVMVGQPAWWNVTKKGLDLIGREYGYKDMSHYFYIHTWTCNFLRLWYDLWFARNNIDIYTLKTERVLWDETKGKNEAYPDLSYWFLDTYDTVDAELNEKRPTFQAREGHNDRYEAVMSAYRKLSSKRHYYYCPEKELKNISRWFKEDPAYSFLVLENRELENGTKYPPPPFSI